MNKKLLIKIRRNITRKRLSLILFFKEKKKLTMTKSLMPKKYATQFARLSILRPSASYYNGQKNLDNPQILHETPKRTTAKDWLDMDLKSQSGSIWTDEKARMLKKNRNYSSNNSKPMILKPDTVKYGSVEIQENPMVID